MDTIPLMSLKWIRLIQTPESMIDVHIYFQLVSSLIRVDALHFLFV